MLGLRQSPLEKLGILLQISPTEDEAKALRAFRGDVGTLVPAEQVLKELAEIPRLSAKVSGAGTIGSAAPWPTKKGAFVGVRERPGSTQVLRAMHPASGSG